MEKGRYEMKLTEKYPFDETFEVYEYQDIGAKEAFHVAAVLAKFVEAWNGTAVPGMPVKFIDRDKKFVCVCQETDAHGFISPYIKTEIWSGRVLFWVFLKPECVNELHHEFTINVPLLDEDREWNENDCDYRGC
jgi:hypothetical protein